MDKPMPQNPHLSDNFYAWREIQKRHALFDYCGHFALWVMFLSAYSQAPGLALAVLGAILHFAARWAGLYNNYRVAISVFILGLVASGFGFGMYLVRDAASLPPMGVN